MNVATLNTDTWRDHVTGARGYAAAHGSAMAPTTAKSFAKAICGRPTRRGAPPH